MYIFGDLSRSLLDVVITLTYAIYVMFLLYVILSHIVPVIYFCNYGDADEIDLFIVMNAVETGSYRSNVYTLFHGRTAVGEKHSYK